MLLISQSRKQTVNKKCLLLQDVTFKHISKHAEEHWMCRAVEGTSFFKTALIKKTVIVLGGIGINTVFNETTMVGTPLSTIYKIIQWWLLFLNAIKDTIAFGRLFRSGEAYNLLLIVSYDNCVLVVKSYCSKCCVAGIA